MLITLCLHSIPIPERLLPVFHYFSTFLQNIFIPLFNLNPFFFFIFFFFFNDPAPSEIYPLPLHAALPIFEGLAENIRWQEIEHGSGEFLIETLAKAADVVIGGSMAVTERDQNIGIARADQSRPCSHR